MQISVSKMVAVSIAAAYVIAAFILEKSWPFSLTVAVGTLLPLALIWFPEFLGGLTGWGAVPVDQPSPPMLVTGAGWLFLLGAVRQVLVILFAGKHEQSNAILLSRPTQEMGARDNQALVDRLNAMQEDL